MARKTTYFRISLGVVVLVGALSNAAWLAEIVYGSGWAGLEWLQGSPFGTLIGVMSAAFCLVLPVAVTHRPSVWRVLVTFALASVAGGASFIMARGVIFTVYSRTLWLSSPDSIFYVKLAALGLGSVCVTVVGFTVLVRMILNVQWPWWMALLFTAAVGLVIPMSLLTIELVPAINGSTDFIHAVKMGYPLFWTSVLVGSVSSFGARHSNSVQSHALKNEAASC